MKTPGLHWLTLGFFMVAGWLFSGTILNRMPAGDGHYENQVPAERKDEAGETLHLVSMSGYLPEQLRSKFEKYTGIQLRVSEFQHEDDLLKFVLDAEEARDIVIAPEYVLVKLMRSGKLAKVENKKIPNFGLLDEQARRIPFDRGLQYVVPLTKKALGISFNVKYFDTLASDWRKTFSGIENDYFNDRIGMPGDERVALAASLMMGGASPNSIDTVELETATTRLVDGVENFGLRFSDRLAQELASEEMLAAITWNDAGSRAFMQNSNLRFVIPTGPTVVTYDCIATLQSDAASSGHQLINFLLQPDNMAALSNHHFVANAVSVSYRFVERFVRYGPGFMEPLEADEVFLTSSDESEKLRAKQWGRVSAAKRKPDLLHLPLPTFGLFGSNSGKSNGRSRDFDSDDWKLK